MRVNSFSLPFSLPLSIFVMCMGAPVFFSRWVKYPRFKFTIHVCTCPERGDDDQSRLSTNDRNAEEQWRQLMSGHRARFFFKESEVEFFKKEKMITLKSKFPPQHRRSRKKNYSNTTLTLMIYCCIFKTVTCIHCYYTTYVFVSVEINEKAAVMSIERIWVTRKGETEQLSGIWSIQEWHLSAKQKHTVKSQSVSVTPE